MSVEVEGVSERLADAILSCGAGNVSRHIEEILSPENIDIFRTQDCIDIVVMARDLIRRSGESRTFIFVASLPVSTRLLARNLEPVRDLVGDMESGAVYLFQGDDFLADALEEYRRVIEDKIPSGFSALYRSWRPLSAPRHLNEFFNDVYLSDTKRA